MEDGVKQGIKYMLFASLLFAIMGALAKNLSTTISSVEVVFFRNVFGVFIILYSIYKQPLKQKGGKLFLLIFRGLIGFLALLLFFYNISKIPLSEAMTFSKTSTIFTAIFAALLLKEKIGISGWIGVFVGFIGILFITGFNGSFLGKTDILGILTGIGAAMAYTSVRELRTYYDSRAIVLSFMLIGTIGPLFLMFLSLFYRGDLFDFIISPFVMPHLNEWAIILCLGVVATFAQIYMTKAYSFAKAGIIGTISYASIVFSIISSAC